MKWSLFPLTLLTLLAVAQQADPTLKSFDPISYPPLARQARIQGQVQLEFFVNHHGDVVAVNVISGHPLLAAAAVENVKSWKFRIARKAALDDQRYQTVFDFEMEEKADLPSGRNAQVELNSFHQVHVITTIPPLNDVQISGCPSDEERQTPIPSKTDYVKMSRTGCYGTCPAYTVGIHADGEVDWEGHSYVAVKKSDSTEIAPTVAQDLLEKFASEKFWQLCSDYSRGVTDSSTTIFKVRIGGRIKTVSNYANSAPKSLDELEYAVDEAADTHLWLHGDPPEESLSHIEDDGYGPKPGLTPLMRAAARADVATVRNLLKEGGDANEVDASGWSVLMYAQPVEFGEGGTHLRTDLISVLLAAGANPHYSSPRGDTPLMAAAYDERFEEALVLAGSNVNAQNLDGVSALMILATKAKAGEIEKALRVGADPRLKDAKGRTAFDYLKLSNCAKNPLRTSSDPIVALEGDECNILDSDDFLKSEKLLTANDDRANSQYR